MEWPQTPTAVEHIQNGSVLHGVRIGSQEPSVEFKEKIFQFLLNQAPEIDLNEAIIEDCSFVLWNDSSMGCAEKGKVYLCVIIPGFRVLVHAKDQRVILHTNEDASCIIQEKF